MRKGDATRAAILDEAGNLATTVGLAGVTIGLLADRTEMSKSGLFAHFGSKESLQLQVLEHTGERFAAAVLRPALKEPRGEPRIRALVEGWIAWVSGGGGCLLVSSAFELDDQPGPVRERLVANQRDWLDAMAMIFSGGVTERQFRADADARQFAQDLEGVLLAYHLTSRLLGDPDATTRARRSLDALLAAAR